MDGFFIARLGRVRERHGGAGDPTEQGSERDTWTVIRWSNTNQVPGGETCLTILTSYALPQSLQHRRGKRRTEAK